MKFYLCILLVALVAGCSKRERLQEAKISQLEERLGALEQSQQTLTNKVRQLFVGQDLIMNAFQTNINQNLDAIGNINSNVDEWMGKQNLHLQRLNDSVMAILAYSAKHTVAAPTPPSGYKMGVPINTYRDIESKALSLWPGDYRMQETEIKLQCDSYRNLHP